MNYGASPRFTFTLARSSDKSTLQPIVDATARGLTLFYNRPGSFTVTAPIDSDVALKARELGTCIICNVVLFDDDGDELEGGRREIWSGPIFNINDSCPDDKTQITALGWFHELESRFLDARLPAAAAKAGGLIAFDLLDLANAKVDSLGRPQPTHISRGVQTDTQTRVMSYERGHNIAEAIRELSELENGYDYYVDPVTRQLYFKPPTDFVDRTEVKFGYQRSPHNIASINQASDASKTRSKISVQGTSAIHVQDDPAAIDASGLMMEDYVSLTDVNDLNVLGAYAGGELAISSMPEKLLTIVPASPTLGERGVPILFRDFEIGDRVYVSADRGRLQLENQPCRVFGANLAFDQEGNMRVNSIDINYSS
jgi:hypothetical protein